MYKNIYIYIYVDVCVEPYPSNITIAFIAGYAHANMLAYVLGCASLRLSSICAHCLFRALLRVRQACLSVSGEMSVRVWGMKSPRVSLV